MAVFVLACCVVFRCFSGASAVGFVIYCCSGLLWGLRVVLCWFSCLRECILL